MAVDLVDVATATFRRPVSIEQSAEHLRLSLGLGANYVGARLAIALSLAVHAPPPNPSGELGGGIKGETLFGTGADLATWITLVIEHSDGQIDTVKALQAAVSAHWFRGTQLMEQTLSLADDEPQRFWEAIAEGAALPDGDDPSEAHGAGPIARTSAIAIPIGSISQELDTDAPVAWVVNASGSSPHVAVMGGVGSGKTRTAAEMLKAIRLATPVPIIAFDFKGDMTDSDNALDRAFGATIVTPTDAPIPLDVLALPSRGSTTIPLAAQRFRDSLATLKSSSLGARQKEALATAAERALRTRSPCRLADIRDSLKAEYAGRNQPDDGATATLNDLCRIPLFEPTLSPAEFFARSWIIRLPQDLPDLVRSVVVTLMTDALDRHLNSLADAPTDPTSRYRTLRCLCVIDEAHRILGAKLPGLSSLIRLSRSKGGAVMLISQSPDDFVGVDDDFLAEMGAVIAFSTNARAAAATRILGRGANLALLGRGMCFVKFRNEATRTVVAWR